jgi:hypothetical protein
MERLMATNIPTTISPIHKAHSVACLNYIIQLSRPIAPAELEALQPAFDSLSDELPLHLQLTSARVDLHNGVGQAQTEKAGESCQRLAPDGQPQWALNTAESRIAAQCTDFQQWQSDWQRAKRLLDVICTPLSIIAPGIGVVALIHSILHQFVSTEDVKAYDCRSLFKEGCRFLTRQVEDSGPIWHVHQGWFEPLEVPIRGRLLHIVNIGTTIMDRKVVTSIDQGTHYQFPKPEPLGSFFGPISRQAPDTYFEDAHRRNQDLLISSLKPDVLRRIGLGLAPARANRSAQFEPSAS